MMKVALVGLSCLQAHGLRSLLESGSAGCEVTIYSTAADQGWQQADCHIVSAAALAALARFLMPRLDRVLLVTTSAPIDAPMPMVSPLASEQEIRAALDTLIDNSAETMNPAATHTPLTPREVDVLRLTAAGVTSKQIAEQLCISLNTVLTHRKNIASKTGLHTVSAITHFAMVHGLLH